MFIVASCVKGLSLEVETLEKSLYVNSPLGTRASVDKICRACKLEISGILLTMNLRVIDMSEFDVILGMDWLTAHRVVIDCDCRRVIAYTQDGIRVMFQGDKHDALPQTVYNSKWHRQLMGQLESLTLEDEVRQYLDMHRVVASMRMFFQMSYQDYLRTWMWTSVLSYTLVRHPFSMTLHGMALIELQELNVQMQE